MNSEQFKSIRLVCQYIIHSVKLLEKLTGRKVVIKKYNMMETNESYQNYNLFDVYFSNKKDCLRMLKILKKILKPKNVIGKNSKFVGPAIKIDYINNYFRVWSPLQEHNNREIANEMMNKRINRAILFDLNEQLEITGCFQPSFNY